ncbi:MAG: cell division protein FtsW [Bacteroidetes bacterium]|nr:cell division protein FtsW [Bacteroidota bacterium]
MENQELITPSGERRSMFDTSHIVQSTKGDKVIWGLVVLLTLVSLLAVYSSTGLLAYKKYQGNTEAYLIKQVGFIIFGIAMVYFAHRVNYKYYSRIAQIAFLVSIPLLIYTLFFGVKMNEGSRWIKLPIINMTLQTSDFAKLALFMYLSRGISKRQDQIKQLRSGYLPLILPVLLICGLIAPANLSTALLLGASCLLLLFIGRASIKHLLATVGIALIPLVFLILAAISQHDRKGTSSPEAERVAGSSSALTGRVSTWVNRVEQFLYGSDDINDDAYQVNQAKIAISKGGLLGVGPGRSTTRDFLPQAYNDFIYAIIIEEYGIAGGAFILFVYLVFLFRCIRIFKRCPYAFGAFLALGLSFTLAIQAMVNMAVTVNLFPVTGVTLPLVSMGGTSFLFTCLSIGIILSVARHVEQQQGTHSSTPEPITNE